MTIKFSCEQCGKQFEVDETMAGKRCKCKQCGHIFPVPAAASSRPATSPAPSRPTGPSTVPRAASAPPSKPVEDDLFATVPPPARRVVPEAELEDDPPVSRPGRPKAKGEPARKAGGSGILVPLIIVGALGGLFLVVVVGAALLLPAINAARQAAERARAKAEGRAVAQRSRPVQAPQPVALSTTPAPVVAIPTTPASADDPLVNDDYRTNEQFLKDILDKMTQMGDLLASIRDQRSAQQVSASVQTLANDLMQSETRAKSLPPLTEEQDNQLGQKYQASIQAAKERVERETARVQKISNAPNLANQRVPNLGPRMGRPPLAASRIRPRIGVRGPIPPPPPGATPVPMDPNTTITVNVDGVDDKDAADLVREKVSAIMKGLGRGWRYSSKRTGSILTFTISGVSDPQVFADHVNFGTVTRVAGRIVDVVAAPIQPGEIRPPDSDFIAQALHDLKSSLPQTRKQALSRLARTPADASRRAEVAQAIVPMLQEPDGFTRSDAAKALAVWGGPESTPALIEALKDTAFNVRWAVLDALKELKDPQASEALAALVAEDKDRGKAVDALKAIGPPAEDAVIPLLSNGEDRVRVEACKILSVIGSEKSVPMLRRLATSKLGFSDNAARDALTSMNLRGVNLNVTAKKKRR